MAPPLKVTVAIEQTGRVLLHPATVRVVHWLNALAVFMMVASGWRIYNNVPIFSWLHFNETFTLGGDPDLTYRLNGDAGFGNALLWHFAAMWLLVVNGLVYLIYGLVSGRIRRKFFPISPLQVWQDFLGAVTFRLKHEDISVYNGVQRLLYVGVVLVLMVIVASGLAIWKPVQFQWITALMGGFQGARLVHFVCMSAIVGFVVVHVTLALLVPRTLLAMITGWARIHPSLKSGMEVPTEPKP